MSAPSESDTDSSLQSKNDEENGAPLSAFSIPPPLRAARVGSRAVTRLQVPANQLAPKAIYANIIQDFQKKTSGRTLRKRTLPHPPPTGSKKVSMKRASRSPQPPTIRIPSVRVRPSLSDPVIQIVEVSAAIPPPPRPSKQDEEGWIHQSTAQAMEQELGGSKEEPTVTLAPVPEKLENATHPGDTKKMHELLQQYTYVVRLEKLPDSHDAIKRYAQSQQDQKELEQKKKRKEGADHYTFTSSDADDDSDTQYRPTPSPPKVSRFGNSVSSNSRSRKNFYHRERGAVCSKPQLPLVGRNQKDDIRKGPTYYDPQFPIDMKPARSMMTRSQRNGVENASTISLKRRIKFDFSSSDEKSEEEDADMKRALILSRQDADEKQRMELESSKLPCPPSCPPLTEDMIGAVKQKFAMRPKDAEIITKFSLTIRQRHFALFEAKEWLEDPNIDFYLEMIQERNERMRAAGFNYPKICIFHSFVFKLCSRNAYEAARANTNVNLFDCDLAFFPIIVGDHWRLIVADFNRKTLYCYDSMFRVNDHSLKIIQRYLQREYKLKMDVGQTRMDVPMDPLADIPNSSATMSPESEPELEPEEETTTSHYNTTVDADGIETISFELPTPYTDKDVDMNGNLDDVNAQSESSDPEKTVLISQIPAKIPSWRVYNREWLKGTVDPIKSNLCQQKNGFDCGIFLCQYAETLARGMLVPFDFGQVNMLYYRYLMAYETIQGNLMDRTPQLPRLIPEVLSPPPSNS